MPAKVNHQQRRQQVVEATFRLVVAEGINGVSLRKVANESGLNIGSVRHYFDGHHDLLAAAAEEAGARMERRLAAHPAEQLRGLTGEKALDALQTFIEAVMPVDRPRREEAIVVIELITASRTMPVFHTVSTQMAKDLADVLLEALNCLEIPNSELAVAQLASVIGGLTLDTVTPHGALTVNQLRTTLRSFLQMLVKTGEGER